MPESLTFCGRTFSPSELELMRQIAREFSASRSDRDRAHRLRVAGVETAQWRVEEPRVPATAGAAPGRRLPAASRAAKVGREGSATGGCIRGLLGTGARRMRRQRVRASGTGSWWKAKRRAAGGASRWNGITISDVACRSARTCATGCGISDRELACLLWTSPAWKMQARDAWIGWSDEQRRAQPAIGS